MITVKYRISKRNNKIIITMIKIRKNNKSNNNT